MMLPCSPQGVELTSTCRPAAFQAASKGVEGWVVGLIFGIFEFVIFLTSPFFGTYVSTQFSVFHARTWDRFVCFSYNQYISGIVIVIVYRFNCTD